MRSTRSPTSAEAADVYAFIGARNVPGAQLCLHLTERPEDVAADLAELDGPLTERCAILPGPDGWQGVIAWDIGGTDGHRAWLFGPWSAQPDRAVHRRLLRAALARLPPEVTRVDNFIDADFADGIDAHLAMGFAHHKTVYVMRADGHRPVPPPDGVSLVPHRQAAAGWRGPIEALHELAFPGTHTAIAEIAAGDPQRDGLWLAYAAGQPVGYVHARLPADVPEGQVQYVAVSPAARGRGVGRALLAVAVQWLLAGGAPVVYLTVDAENERALAVYLGAGFTRHRVGWSLTLERAPSAN